MHAWSAVESRPLNHRPDQYVFACHVCCWKEREGGTQVARIACKLVTLKFETNESLPALPPAPALIEVQMFFLSTSNVTTRIFSHKQPHERRFRSLHTSTSAVVILCVLPPILELSFLPEHDFCNFVAANIKMTQLAETGTRWNKGC